jgi:hypothetical protein
MTRVRSLATELVERRLWPVAVALVLALVAVPLLLAGGGDSAAPRDAAGRAQAPARGTPAAVVSVAPEATVKRRRSGRVRDPFTQPPAPRAETAAAAPSGPGAGPLTPSQDAAKRAAELGASGVVPTTPSGVVGTDDGPRAPAVTHVPRVNARYVYRAVVRVRQAGRTRWLRDVARLDRLPSKRQPFAVFLGVMSDRRTAVFVMSALGRATGDGACRPSSRACVTFELKPGQSQLLTIPGAGGQVTRVRLTLRRIVVKPVRASASARR